MCYGDWGAVQATPHPVPGGRPRPALLPLPAASVPAPASLGPAPAAWPGRSISPAAKCVPIAADDPWTGGMAHPAVPPSLLGQGRPARTLVERAVSSGMVLWLAGRPVRGVCGSRGP